LSNKTIERLTVYLRKRKIYIHLRRIKKHDNGSNKLAVWFNGSNDIGGMEVFLIRGSELTVELSQSLLISKGKECVLVLKGIVVGISVRRIPINMSNNQRYINEYGNGHRIY